MSGDAREINLVKAASQQPLIKTRDNDDPTRVKIFNNLKSGFFWFHSTLTSISTSLYYYVLIMLAFR